MAYRIERLQRARAHGVWDWLRVVEVGTIDDLLRSGELQKALNR